MRVPCRVLAALPVLYLSQGFAQESAPGAAPGATQHPLCDPCLYDAPVRPPRGDFAPAERSTIITAEDMRALGIVGVADMIEQLPQRVEVESVPLTEPGPADDASLADEADAESDDAATRASDE